jgi:hypothetical protein
MLDDGPSSVATFDWINLLLLDFLLQIEFCELNALLPAFTARLENWSRVKRSVTKVVIISFQQYFYGSLESLVLSLLIVDNGMTRELFRAPI